MRIYDLKSDKYHKEISLNQFITVNSFTIDSSLLFIGVMKGYVYSYNVLKNFHLMFKLQIHLGPIFDLKTIKN